ncbi:MAG: hypothetical protein Kow0062_22320 [Acidobacteriota bacterium]
MTSGAGVLWVVATPIGNLDDLAPRAVEVLREADLVLAEDTRRTRGLLARCGIDRPLVSHHRFNEAAGVSGLIERLLAGETIALVSDGGTPLVSDPGRRLVEAAHAAGIRVSPVPGPSAVTAALSVAGLPAERFVFAGFLPPRRAARRRALEELATVPMTLVFLEAPHRLAASLADMARVLGGDRAAVLCRELTKLHEEVVRAPLGELAGRLASRDRIRGEIVLVVGGAAPGTARPAGPDRAERTLLEAWREALAAEQGDARRALRRLARALGRPRAEIKRRLDAARAGYEDGDPGDDGSPPRGQS